MSAVVKNEKTKLTANLLNTLAAAILVTGLVAPGVAASYDLAVPFRVSSTMTVAIVWIFIGTALHILARQILEKIES